MRLFGRKFEAVAAEVLAREAVYSKDRRTFASNLSLLLPYFRGKRIDRIGPREIETMLAHRLREGVTRATANRQRAALSKIFTAAIAWGYMAPPNPCRRVKKFAEPRGRTRYLSPGEFARLVTGAAPHLKPILQVAVETGGRLREILSLCWRDVDVDAGLVRFRWEVTKSSREREVPLTPRLREALAGVKRGKPDDPIFRFRDRPLKAIRTAFLRARDRAGLPGLRFHDLRHTYASWAAQNGLDIYRLQQYLGHSTPAMTQRYAHLSREYLRDGVRFIGPPGLEHRPDEDRS